MRGRWYLVEGVWVSERLIRSARPRVPSPVVSALSQTSLCHATCTGCPHSSPTVAPSGQQSGTAPVSRMSGGTGEEMRCEMRHASSGEWVVMKIGRFSPPPFSNEPFVVSRSRQTREPTAPCLSYPSIPHAALVGDPCASRLDCVSAPVVCAPGRVDKAPARRKRSRVQSSQHGASLRNVPPTQRAGPSPKPRHERRLHGEDGSR